MADAGLTRALRAGASRCIQPGGDADSAAGHDDRKMQRRRRGLAGHELIRAETAQDLSPAWISIVLRLADGDSKPIRGLREPAERLLYEKDGHGANEQ